METFHGQLALSHVFEFDYQIFRCCKQEVSVNDQQIFKIQTKSALIL